MSEPLGVSIEDLVATAKQRKVRIPSEIGAFVALEVCEALIDGPAAPNAAEVRIAEDGSISVLAPRDGAASSEEAARSVVSLLGALLVAAGAGVPRLLVRIIEEGPTSGRWDLASLRDDLEASLVPLNRSAARRVLSRMLRDVRRPRSVRPSSSEPAPAPPEDASLDAQLDALLDGKSATRDARPREPVRVAEAHVEHDATISELDAPESDRARPARAVARHDSDDATLHDAGDEPPGRRVPSTAPTEPPPPKRREPSLEHLPALGDEPRRPRRTSSLTWVIALVAVCVAAAAALALLRPDLVDDLLRRETRTSSDERGPIGVLTVDVSTPGAQVLRFVGRGPAVAGDLPVGVAHEFVAMSDGRRPARAIVPAGARWEPSGEGPRYELAIQAGEEPMAELDLGPTQLPRDLGRPSGRLGSVRVVTNPPGAKVYVLAGFSPSVTIENVRTDVATELLVVAPGARVSRVVVGPSDWEEQPDGSRRASISVALQPPAP